MFGNPDDNTNVGAQNTNSGQSPLNNPMDTGLDTPIAPASPSTTVAPTPSDTNNNFVMTEPSQPAPSGSIAPMNSTTEATTDTSSGNTGSNDLMGIKRQALQQLSPLVSHLDQSPEEEFRTTMMMIQASDDQSLIQKAYDAAQKISDEKTRAQALLDIVNEINYFTQQKNGQASPPQLSEE